jgi:hypothetical protein
MIVVAELSMPSELSSWLSRPALLWGLGGFSIVAVAATVVLVPRYVAGLPPDFLQAGSRAQRGSVALRVLRNLLGVVLALLGVAMLLLPGQGLITLLVGLLLVDFPGKQKLIQRVLGRPRILAAVNKLRSRHGAPPLKAP